MRPFGRLIPVDTAVHRALAVVRPVTRSERVQAAQLLGRVAETTVTAPRPVPEFARATWDGYALRAADTRSAGPGHPVSLRVVGEVYAEGSFGRRLRAGEAVAIATGGAMPGGTDSVLIFEEAGEKRGTITARQPVARGERVADPGDDFPRGAVLVRPGQVFDPAAIGALAATGRTSALVRRRPVVSLIPNGDELLSPGAARRRGAVYEINNLTLGAVATAAGAEVRSLPPVRDDERRIEAAVRTALRGSDLVVVTGGSSVGAHDFLPSIFPRIGRLLFHGIAVRPGKPTLAAVAGGKLLLGMPGHPTSCLCNGFWLLGPVVRKLSGRPGPGWVDGTAVLAAPIPRPSGSLSTVVPLRLSEGRAYPTFRDSSAITSLSGANAFVLYPPGSPRPRVGSTLSVRRLLPPVAAG
ncbi:MAG TPA: molybdopterin molybdotransferase MoeA [Thermoplasmata archaeon]